MELTNATQAEPYPRGRFATTRLALRLRGRRKARPEPGRIFSADGTFHRGEALYVNVLYWSVLCSAIRAAIVSVGGGAWWVQAGAIPAAIFLYPFVFQLLLLVMGGIRRLLAAVGIGRNMNRGELMGRLLSIVFTLASLALIWHPSPFRIPALVWLSAVAVNVSAFVLEMPFALVQSDPEPHETSLP
jgi:hypothetical protein